MKKLLIATFLFACAGIGEAAFLPGPIQISTGSGTPNPVGYALNNSSVPISIVGGSISNTTFASTESGAWSVSPGTGTYPVAITGGSIANTSFAATQSGAWSVSPGTGTYPVAITGGSIANTSFASTQSGAWSVSPGTGSYPASQTGTWTVQPGNTPNTTPWLMYITNVTTSPLQVQNGAGALTSVGWQTNGASVPVHEVGIVTVTGTVIANAGTGIFNTSGSTVVITAPNNNTTPIPVSGSFSATSVNFTTATYGATFPTIGAAQAFIGQSGLTQAARVNISSDVYVAITSSPAVQGFAASGAVIAGNPVPTGLFVSSTSLPTAQPDGDVIYHAGTNIGQALITGVPFGLIRTSTATLTTTTSEIVLISSAAANTYTYLCGCVITNTSATNASVKFRQQGPSATEANNILIGAPANFVPAGIWQGCTNPFMRSAPASNITVQGSASVTSLEVRCQYYQAS